MRRWLLRAVLAIWLGSQVQNTATAQQVLPPQGHTLNSPTPRLGFAQASAFQQAYIPQPGTTQQESVHAPHVLPGGPVTHDMSMPFPYGGGPGTPYQLHDFSHPGWGQNGWTPYVYPPAPWGLPPDPYYMAASGQPEGCWLRRACLNCLNHCGTGCYATHNNIGCSSCYAQLVFAFGSCRQWYGTPCIPQPPKPHPCLDNLRQKGLFNGGLFGNQGGCGPNGCGGQ